MSLVEVILLGLVHGSTEFLPISSAGHLALVQDFLTTNSANSMALIGMLHITTALAAMVYLRSDIWILIQAMLRKLGRLPVNDKDITFFYAVCLGTVPAVTVALVFEQYLSKNLKNAGVIAGTSFLFVVFLMYAEWRYYTRVVVGGMTAKRGFLIGLFQIFALLPGFSRLGSALAGGMLLGLSRAEATRFSFLLAIPIMLGIGGRQLLGLITAGGNINWSSIFFSSVGAFFSALLIMYFFHASMRKYTLWPFIWYGVVLSALVGYVSLIS